jgi:CheY-like chemotaxis protein
VAQLFQAFNRLGQRSEEEGTGIGLVVTKRLVEVMGGKIGVESVVGRGSTFWVALIADTAPRLDLNGDEPRTVQEPQPPDGTRMRTLLHVEDNPANLQLVVQIVARRPAIRLLSATNGTLGIELARASRPDVIPMDINLPGMSGIKAMQLLREDVLTSHIPVVALSANAMPRDIERGLQAGFFRYLTKPLRVDEFLETLDVALRHRLSVRRGGIRGDSSPSSAEAARARAERIREDAALLTVHRGPRSGRHHAVPGGGRISRRRRRRGLGPEGGGRGALPGQT